MNTLRLCITIFVATTLLGSCNPQKRIQKRQAKDYLKGQEKLAELLIKYPELVGISTQTKTLAIPVDEFSLDTTVGSLDTLKITQDGITVELTQTPDQTRLKIHRPARVDSVDYEDVQTNVELATRDERSGGDFKKPEPKAMRWLHWLGVIFLLLVAFLIIRWFRRNF